MAKALKLAFSAITKAAPTKSSLLSNLSKQSGISAKCLLSSTKISSVSSRTHGSLSYLFNANHILSSKQFATRPSTSARQYSTEVDQEIAKFLEKEIQYETSRAANDLPKIAGFEITTDGGDVTLTKKTGTEKVVVKLSVNGAVDSILSEGGQEKQNEPPQMVCRPPFEVEISKAGQVLAFQCNFPVPEEPYEDAEEYAKNQDADRIDDQFEIQEVAIHNGEWKETTFSVSAATMDAELFDLLMDMLDERGINDEFIAQLVDFCTAYENNQYITFLKQLKEVAEK